MSLGQARLLPGGRKKNILWGRERTLHRFAGFVFKGRGAVLLWLAFLPSRSKVCAVALFMTFTPTHAFPPMAKGQFPWAESGTWTHPRSWLCYWVSTVLFRWTQAQKDRRASSKPPQLPQLHSISKKDGQVSPGNACANILTNQAPSLLKTENNSYKCKTAFQMVPSIGIWSFKPLTQPFV